MNDIKLHRFPCHLIFENFEKDLEDVVLRLRSRGVKKLVHACCELKEIPKLKKISRNFIKFTIQLVYILRIRKMGTSFQVSLRSSAQEDRKVVAIGELGLDF